MVYAGAGQICWCRLDEASAAVVPVERVALARSASVENFVAVGQSSVGGELLFVFFVGVLRLLQSSAPN